MEDIQIRVKATYNHENSLTNYESLSPDYPFKGYFKNPWESVDKAVARELGIRKTSTVTVKWDFSTDKAVYYTATIHLANEKRAEPTIYDVLDHIQSQIRLINTQRKTRLSEERDTYLRGKLKAYRQMMKTIMEMYRMDVSDLK